jgi:hypothetical protein
MSRKTGEAIIQIPNKQKEGHVKPDGATAHGLCLARPDTTICVSGVGGGKHWLHSTSPQGQRRGWANGNTFTCSRTRGSENPKVSSTNPRVLRGTQINDGFIGDGVFIVTVFAGGRLKSYLGWICKADKLYLSWRGLRRGCWALLAVLSARDPIACLIGRNDRRNAWASVR